MVRRRPKSSLTVEVTTRCNRDCAYCYNVWKADPAYPRDELPASAFLALVESALEASGIGHVQVSGGEPLLRSDLVEILEGIQAFGADVSLVTDGGLIDDEMASTLARLGVGPVQPTLLAADRDLHNDLKGADCFDATVAAIDRLGREGVPVCVAFVCTRLNHTAFRDVVELCFALGVRAVAFNRLCVVGEGGKRRAELAPTRDMIAACLDVAQWANERLLMNVSAAISLPLCVVDKSRTPNLSFGRCAIQTESPGFTLDPVGNLRACSISPTILGNLRTEPWHAILSRAEKDYFREMAVAPDSCRECSLVSHCGGGCRESALACFGELNRRDPLADSIRF